MEGKSILLTGSSGSVGSAVLLSLLQSGYSVTSIDKVPLPQSVIDCIPPGSSYSHHTFDLVDYHALDKIFDAHGPFSGVIHLSALPAPIGHDPRLVHNLNVALSYNVMQTAAMRGVKRIVQASSVNALGLSYTPEGRQKFAELPIREDGETCAMDPYALSKQICELQAECIVRTDPTIRIASLRFHHVVPDLAAAIGYAHTTELWAYTSHRAAAESCVLGLTSEGWEGAEAFNIVAPDICWVGGKSKAIEGHPELQGEVGTEELVHVTWGSRVGKMRAGYWDGNPRRGCWDIEKARRLLGWVHED